jgi:hypothetical protein
MTNDLMNNIDRNTVIGVIVASCILGFFSYKILIIYLLVLLLGIIIINKWQIINNIKLNKLLNNITLSILVIFCITILAEIWLQVYPHRFTGIDRVDTVGDFSDYTSRGLFTEDIFKKRPDVARILGLGDSFSVYLADKGKNYLNILQQKFIAGGKSDVEIVNAGMAAIGPGYYWHILSKYGDLFKPDLVLVSFFVGNDIEDADFNVCIGKFISEPKDLIKRYSRYYQFNKLRLYKLLRNKYIWFRESQLKKREAQHNNHKQVGTFSQDTFISVEKKRSWIFDKNNQDELQKEWHKCSDIILKIKNWCDRRKINLVITLLPDQFQVDQKVREAVLDKYKNITEKNLDLAQPDNLIMNFCRAHNIHCLDLLGQFQEQGKTRQLYTLRDTHWNEAGNRLAAELIFEYLEANHLVSSQTRQ